MLWLILIIIAIIYFHSKKKKNSDNLVSNSNQTRISYLKSTIDEFSLIISRNPNKKLSDQLKDYQEELENLTKLNDDKSYVIFTDSENANSSDHHDLGILKQDVNTLWSNWYSNNSINLLLYIGAFLIVASASIFVGFQWETIGGEIKAIMITLLTLAFFGFGTYFHKIPKIQNAGATFTAIGALLIPFCGMAWYNFVLSDTGITLGQVWFATSLISLSTNIILANYYKNPLYTYFASLGSLSLVLSMVNIYKLNKEFYILGSIISSFILFIAQILLSKKDKQNYKLYLQPLELTANILMPVSLFLGAIFAISDDKLFTAESTFSGILASTYYFACYATFKKPLYLLASEIIFPISVSLLFSWQKFPLINLLYTLGILGMIDLFLANSFSKNKLQQESDISLIIGLTKTILIFVVSLITSQETSHQITLSLITIFSGLTASWVTHNIKYILISTSILTITLYIIITKLLNVPNEINILALIYLAVAVFYYSLSVYLKDKDDYPTTFLTSSFLYFILSFILNLGSVGYLLITNLVITITLFFAYKQFGNKNLIYLSAGFFNLSVFNLLKFYNWNFENFSFVYSSLSFLIYFASNLFEEETRQKVKKISLVMNIATPIFFGIISFSGPKILEKNTLMTAYASTLLFGIEAYISKRSDIAYITSVIGMVTYLWQIQYFDVSESLFYTIPLGIYFLSLSYFRKLASDEEKQQLFNVIGLLFLILPNLVLSYNESGQKYWLILVLIGICLVSLGISLKDKIITYGGIAAIALAILSQTFQYIFSLPKWLITGLGGIIFLVSAIFLLLKRKEDN